MSLPPIVSRAEWLAARVELLAKEKDATRARDALNAKRRRLPMVRIEKDYLFDGPAGTTSLLDLFDGRRQLITHHFMFDPSWGHEGCPSCSRLADSVGHLAHLHARDTSLAVVSRAPLAQIEVYKKRMGWSFPWFSSYGSEFNYDFHVTMDPAITPAEYNYVPSDDPWTGEMPGHSVFLRDGDQIFHTYSNYARGGDVLIGTYNYLDLTPYGRQEDWEDSPAGWPQTPTHEWLRRHDAYDAG